MDLPFKIPPFLSLLSSFSTVCFPIPAILCAFPIYLWRKREGIGAEKLPQKISISPIFDPLDFTQVGDLSHFASAVFFLMSWLSQDLGFQVESDFFLYLITAVIR
mgnify:CR=1 FL=1